MSDNGELGSIEGKVVITSDTSDLDKVPGQLDAVKKSGESTGAAMQKVSTGMMVAGGLIVAGLALAVGAAANFEASLSGIKAVSGATEDQMKAVSDKALQLGKDTKFSAGEAATAIEELAKAGLTLPEILNGAADAVVNLAAAGEIGLPEAATIAANAMNMYGLAAEDMVSVVDSIAGAANASAIDVSQFGMALAQSGAVANLAGLDFNDTAVAIAELGNAGLKGSDAGTSLKSMLMNLQPATKKAREEMTSLGLYTKETGSAFYDQAGNVKPLSQIQGVLADSLRGLSKEQQFASLRIMFGSDAIRAAAILAKEGAEGYGLLNDEMHKTTAAEVAAERMNNLMGSVEQLKGSAETLGIQLGTTFIPILRELADWLTGVLNWFMELDPTIQKVIVVVAALTGGILLFGGATLKAIKFTQEFAGGVKTLADAFSKSLTGLKANTAALQANIVAGRGVTTTTTAAGVAATGLAAAEGGATVGAISLGAAIKGIIISLGPIAIAFAAASAVMAVFMGISAQGAEATGGWADALYDQTGALVANTQAIIAKHVAETDAYDSAEALGLSATDITLALNGQKAAMDKVAAAINPVIDQYEQWGRGVSGVQPPASDLLDTVLSLNDALNSDSTALAKAAENAKQTSEADGVLAGAMEDAAGGVAGLNEELQDLSKMFDDFYAKVNQQAAMDKTKQNLRDIDDLVKKNKDTYGKHALSLNSDTTAGVANRAALTGMFTDVTKASELWGERYGKTEAEVRRRTATMMTELKQTLIKNGFNRGMVNQMMDGLDILPKELEQMAAELEASELAAMTGVGLAIGQGLTAGMTSSRGIVRSTIRGLVQDDIINYSQNLLKTGSPSKVFIDLGGDVVDGFALGLDGLSKLKDKVREPIEEALKAAEDAIAKRLAKIKDKIDSAIAKWRDYRDAVYEAMTGNVDAGTAWTDTANQLDAVKDAQSALTDAQKDYNSAMADMKPGDSTPPSRDALSKAEADLATAQSAVKTFEENFRKQIDDSNLFGIAFVNASNAITGQFGPNSRITLMLTEQMMALGPGAGTALAQYLAGGLSEETKQQLLDWQMWSDEVAAKTATQQKAQGIQNAQNLMLGMKEFIKDQKEKLVNMGLKISDGLVLGFKQGKHNWNDAIDDYIDSMNNKWGVKSPSRVAMYIGEMVGEGFNIGVSNADVAELMARVAAPVSAFDTASAALPASTFAGVPASAGSASPTLTAGSTYVTVLIDGQEFRGMIQTEIEKADDDTGSHVGGM